jgi:cellulose synthase/poly-beta-1,6-N-acetylglucosamine synthase-like glycosyltransferase
MTDTLLIAAISLAVVVVAIVEAGAMRAMVAGHGYLRRVRRRGMVRHDSNTILKSPLAPAISVIGVPPDAGPDSLRFVHELAKLHYGDHEVLVVLDGPSEDDLAAWIRELQLYPSTRGASGDIPTKPVLGVYESRGPFRLMVLEKERGGLADSLNVGLNVAGAQLVGIADPCSHVAPDALLRLVLPFLEQPTVTVASCAGAPPEAGSMAARFHALECTRLWLGRAAGLASRGVTLPPPGSFCLVDRRALRQINGFSAGVFEMVFHLHALFRARGVKYNIEWVDHPLARPHSPATFSELRRAAVAAHREAGRTVWRHLTVLGSLDGLGRVAMPGIMLTGLVRPLLETLGYVCAGVALWRGTIQLQMAGLLLIVTCGFGALNSMLAVLLRESSMESDRDSAELRSLFLAAIPENFGYRQLRNVWLLGGIFSRRRQ